MIIVLTVQILWLLVMAERETKTVDWATHIFLITWYLSCVPDSFLWAQSPWLDVPSHPSSDIWQWAPDARMLGVRTGPHYPGVWPSVSSSSDARMSSPRLANTESKYESMSGWLLQWISLQKHIMRPGRRVRSFWREVFSRKFKFCEISKNLEFSLTCA